MSEFNEANIKRSLYKWFSEEYSRGPLDIGVARRFNESTADSWVDFMISSVTEDACRRLGKRVYDVGIVVRCYGKSTTNLYKSLGDAQAVAELLRHAVIDVLSFDETGTPNIGAIMLKETQMTDETQLQDDIAVDVTVISVDGCAVES